MASRPDIGPATFSSLPPFGRPPLESLAGRAALSRELVRTVDRQPETRGLGIVLIDGRQLCRLRPQGNSGATVVYELRARPSMAMVGSRNTPTTPSHPLPAASVRTRTTSVSAEWIGLGFNCGGAVLAWVGVVGTGALAPVTGGASAIGTVVMWGGAIASTGQCAASVYRTANDYRGRQDINNSLDKSQVYQWTMRSADVIGLVGAGGALKELKTTHAVLMEANVDWKVASAGRLSRPMRRQLTTLLELQGGKRVAGAVIGQLLKKRLLDGAAGALGMVSSAASGMVHEIVVWITDETNGTLATP